MAEFPRDWTVEPLSRLGDVLMCKRVLKSQTAPIGDIPFYKIGTFGKQADAFIPRELFDRFRRTYSFPKPGDVLVSAAGTIGRIVVFDGTDSYFQDSNIVWLGNDESSVLNSYLYWWYQVVKWTTEDGGIVARLYNGNFRATTIAYPDIPEQRRIADALDSVDKLIDNLTRRVEKKRLVKQGVMQALLTGKKRLPGFKGEWRMKQLNALASVKARIGWQGLTTAEYLKDGPHYLVNGVNIQNGRVDWKTCCFVGESRYQQDKNIQLKQFDVLVSKDGTIGKVAYIDRLTGTATLNSGVFVIRSIDEGVNQEYLARIFLSEWFAGFIDKITAGSTIVHLYQKDIGQFEFPVPPTIAEQRAIAEVLSDMDAEIAKLEAKRDKYIDIKRGVMNDLLTGKVRI